MFENQNAVHECGFGWASFKSMAGFRIHFVSRPWFSFFTFNTSSIFSFYAQGAGFRIHFVSCPWFSFFLFVYLFVLCPRSCFFLSIFIITVTATAATTYKVEPGTRETSHLISSASEASLLRYIAIIHPAVRSLLSDQP